MKKAKINRNPVESSNIDSIGYDPSEKVMEIKFKQGGIYRYHPFSADEFCQFMNQPSKGQYFFSNIKFNAKIKCKKIT